MKDSKTKAYKAFDKNLKCRGFQYKIGKTYTHDGNVSICKSGFHSCTNPLDVLNYYDLTDSRFAIVSLEGKQVSSDNDSKISSEKITIDTELKLSQFISLCIIFLKNSCEKNITFGDGSRLASSGDGSKLASSGYGSRLASSGYSSQLASSGDGSRLASSGDGSKLASSGDGSKLASSGDNSRLALSGYSSQLASSGDYNQLASSGDNSRLASSGYSSQLASSGYGSQLASSGYGSQLASSGDYSRLASSGDGSRLASSGDGSIVICSGVGGVVKSGKNGSMALTAWNENKKRHDIIVAYVGENGIKENTYYGLNNKNEFEEIK